MHRYSRGSLLLILLASLSCRLNCAETVYALYRSTDQGRSWVGVDIGISTNARINALASTTTTIIAAADAGILVSTNGAVSWHPSIIHHPNPGSINCIAKLNDRVFAGTSEGILLVSSDDGVSWQRNASFPHRFIRSLHCALGALYVGTDADHVYRSSNLGETWAQLSAGLPALSQVFALTSINGRVFAGLYAKGLYTWNEVDRIWVGVGASADIRPLALAAVGSTLVAGHNPGGIYWSDDLGQNWKRWSHANAPAATGNGIDSFPLLESTVLTSPSVPLESPIWEMAADASIAIAGAGSGIYYSTDRARTWTRATTGLPATSAGIAFCVRPDLILAAVSQGPISRAETQPK